LTGSSRSGAFPRRASGRRGAAIGLGGRLQRLGDERLGASARTTAIADAAGDLSDLEGRLVSQAVDLHAVFRKLTEMGVPRLTENLPEAEICLRLAIEASAQYRATVEALAGISAGKVRHDG
jgi:hypothetical protein